MITWAKVVSIVASLIKPLMYFLIYLGGKKAAYKEVEAEQAKKDAELAKDYLDNRAQPRTDDDVIRRVQDGSF